MEETSNFGGGSYEGSPAYGEFSHSYAVSSEGDSYGSPGGDNPYGTHKTKTKTKTKTKSKTKSGKYGGGM